MSDTNRASWLRLDNTSERIDTATYLGPVDLTV